jgi:hypothetical protein
MSGIEEGFLALAASAAASAAISTAISYVLSAVGEKKPRA